MLAPMATATSAKAEGLDDANADFGCARRNSYWGKVEREEGCESTRVSGALAGWRDALLRPGAADRRRVALRRRCRVGQAGGDGGVVGTLEDLADPVVRTGAGRLDARR